MIAYLILKHAKFVSPMGVLIKQVVISFPWADEFGETDGLSALSEMLWLIRDTLGIINKLLTCACMPKSLMNTLGIVVQVWIINII